MTFTDAACEVLRICGRPLHYKEITEIAIEKNLLSHVGKSPEVTMGARLAATLKKGGEENPLVRVKPGVFALRDWDEDTIRKGLEVKRSSKKPSDEEDEGEILGDEETAPGLEPSEEPAPATPFETPRRAFDTPFAADEIEEEDEVATPPRRFIEETPPAPDEAMRAEIAAGAIEVFGEEDDDDQPILRPGADESAEPMEGGRRRRRRRRRRGSRGGPGEEERGQLPSYTTTPAFNGDDGPAPYNGGPRGGQQQRGPHVIEVGGSDSGPLETPAGRMLADVVAAVLGTFDRTVGAVSLRQISETAQRRGRVSGEQQLLQSQVAAAVRADNARRMAAGMRPRFRMAGGRVGLTDWLLDPELSRLERDALAAIGRYRDAARRALARKVSELPAHAFVELSLLLIERLGVSRLRAVKFPGSSGAESHFTGCLSVPAGALGANVGDGEGLKLAIVVRKDGRDIGRERVSELRGTAHHYDGATMGWIFTAGQVLSGAREEAQTGNFPVTLLDAGGIARLCEQYEVAVVRAQHPIFIPDIDLFEALRAS